MKNLLHLFKVNFCLLTTLKNSLTIVCSFLFLTSTFSQEVCNNNIDDDGDGLIDCYDPNCGDQGLVSLPIFTSATEGYINGSGFTISAGTGDPNQMWNYGTGNVTWWPGSRGQNLQVIRQQVAGTYSINFDVPQEHVYVLIYSLGSPTFGTVTMDFVNTGTVLVSGNANMASFPSDTYGGAEAHGAVYIRGPVSNITWDVSASEEFSTVGFVTMPPNCGEMGAICDNGTIITNGDFENGNTGFTTDYTLNQGLSVGEYWVGTNTTHPALSNCVDHGQYFMVNAGPDITDNVWCQTVSVNPFTEYSFATEVASIHPISPAELLFTVNGTPLSTSIQASTAVCDWQYFTAIWESTTNTIATICIQNNNSAGSGNDFAIDNIFFGPCCTEREQVFIHTGQLQRFVVPDGINEITVQAWGAGGGLEFAGTHGGAGGYTEATLSVTPGDEYIVLVGEGGRGGFVSPGYAAYGGGGRDLLDGGGGGLSGLFSGDGVTIARSTAVVVAGGGGGACSAAEHGRNGNSASSGGMSGLTGYHDYNAAVLDHPPHGDSHTASGGGGYEGGALLDLGFDRKAGLGGSGFVIAGAISNNITSTVDGNRLPPNQTNENYIAGIGVGANTTAGSGGNGLVVISYAQICCNDATMVLRNVDDTNCPGSNITVDIKILNGPDDVIPAGTPISFYDGDPTAAATPLLGTYTLVTPIQNGATSIISDIDIGTCNVSNSDQLIYAVLGDDGNPSAPLDLSTQPSDGYNDCTMEDNMSTIKLRNNCVQYESTIKK